MFSYFCIANIDILLKSGKVSSRYLPLLTIIKHLAMGIKERFKEFIAYKRLTQRRFQASIGVSSSYVNGITDGIGAGVLRKLSITYPELNTDWLLTGEGEMLNHPSDKTANQSISGHHGTSVAGNGNNVNTTSALEKALESLMEQQRLTAKAQEQVDRLLSLMERMAK